MRLSLVEVSKTVLYGLENRLNDVVVAFVREVGQLSSVTTIS